MASISIEDTQKKFYRSFRQDSSLESVGTISEFSSLKDEEIIKKIKKIEEEYLFVTDCCRFLLQKIDNIETQNKQIIELLGKKVESPMIDIINESSNIEIDQTMKSQIINYYKEHGTVYPSDVANALGLELIEVVAIVKELINEGKLEVA